MYTCIELWTRVTDAAHKTAKELGGRLVAVRGARDLHAQTVLLFAATCFCEDERIRSRVGESFPSPLGARGSG